ncbi:hypothetical protein [Kaarinaea lacus]
MLVESNREWWKIKVYNEVSEYLRHPSNARKQQLQTLLTVYAEMHNQSLDSETVTYSEMELSMNDC